MNKISFMATKLVRNGPLTLFIFGTSNKMKNKNKLQ